MLMRASRSDGAVQDDLRDQLVELLPAAARIVAHGWRPWASASFAGARHWFDVRPAGDEDAAAVAKLLAQREWPLAKRFVADVALHLEEAGGGDWRIELLTVDD
jgi:hypothetical protein